LVSSVLGNGLSPTTKASFSSGWTGFMKAAFGARFAFLGALAMPVILPVC
jgi:hypothetical protein